MESPAICPSAWSGMSSEDSGLLLTTSDSLSSSSSNWQYTMELADSDDDYDKCILQSPVAAADDVEENHYDDLLFDDDQFNTVKKKNNITIEPIDPPLEFQDVPVPMMSHNSLEELAEGLVDQIVGEAVNRSEKEYSSRLCCTPEPQSSSRRPASRNSLNSRLSSSHNSLSVPTANKADDSSFITSAMSHDVLDMYNVPLDSDIYTLPVDSLRPSCPQRPKRQHRHHRKRRRNTADTSSAFTNNNATINSKFDSNIAAQPTNRLITDCSMELQSCPTPVDNKRHSLPGTSMSGRISSRTHCTEPIHMTLQEVRQFLHNLYSSASTHPHHDGEQRTAVANGTLSNSTTGDSLRTIGGRTMNGDVSRVTDCSSNNKKQTVTNNRKTRNSKNTFTISIKNRKSKSFNIEPDVSLFNNNNNNGVNNNNNNNNSDNNKNNIGDIISKNEIKSKKHHHPVVSSDNSNKSQGSGCTKNSFSYTLKQTLCNIFKFKRSEVSSQCHHNVADTVLVLGVSSRSGNCPPPFTKRALPPLPSHKNNSNNNHSKKNRKNNDNEDNVSGDDDDDEEEEGDEDDGEETSTEVDLQLVEEETAMDFASSIEKVKDYGWYWGPISGETAEKILSNEPDGSFIVRDSSDDHYIFSLTFKLNGVVRHVRIEHDQGNFSFGSCTKFKSHTIVEFIENAVEHSRSGRYLFFLHRRPIHGPMRVQLLHPVSRFKQVQSLQHMCRFVILKVVRRDLISSLPLPRRIIDYLNSPHYYSEHPSLPPDDQHSSSPSLHVFSFMPPNS
ncbi:uncharacterized protein LOC142329280 [Lycorma delicatula]|uniref:uncharacterized protein LOC142329280 n=1 Tax=Lycorma delicatula TaxID=130591 RepID=UPI003F518D3C